MRSSPPAPGTQAPLETGWRLLAWMLLVAAILLDGAIVLCVRGINAEWGGRHDAGLALGFSFAAAILPYFLLVVAGVAALGMLVAAVRRRPLLPWCASLSVSLLPLVYLTLAGR